MKKQPRSSPVKATIVGWNPAYTFTFQISDENGPREEEFPFTLKEVKSVNGTPLEKKLRNIAHRFGYSEKDVKNIIEGTACRILLSERSISKYIAEKLLDHIPKKSATHSSLHRLLPRLGSTQQPVKTRAIRSVCKLVLKAPEFQGTEGDRLLCKAMAEAYKERLALFPSEEEEPKEGYLLSELPTFFYSPHHRKWIDWKDAYDKALFSAVSQLSGDKKLLRRYGSGYTFMQEGLYHKGRYTKIGKKYPHFSEPDINIPEILASSLERRVMPQLKETRRPYDAEPISNEEACEILSKQRKAIIDPQVRRMVDFVLGRKDAHVCYVGGSATHFTEKGERAGGRAISDYFIEISTNSSPGMLAHECAHIAITRTYQNHAKPFLHENDRKLFVQALRADTRTLGMEQSGLRRDLGITRRLYEYKNFAAEIPAYIIHAKADGEWTPELAKKFPHLTAYVEKIVLPDIELRAKGKHGFVPRPESIEQLVSPDWPPSGKTSPTEPWTGRTSRNPRINRR